MAQEGSKHFQIRDKNRSLGMGSLRPHLHLSLLGGCVIRFAHRGQAFPLKRVIFRHLITQGLT